MELHGPGQPLPDGGNINLPPNNKDIILEKVEHGKQVDVPGEEEQYKLEEQDDIEEPETQHIPLTIEQKKIPPTALILELVRDDPSVSKKGKDGKDRKNLADYHEEIQDINFEVKPQVDPLYDINKGHQITRMTVAYTVKLKNGKTLTFDYGVKTSIPFPKPNASERKIKQDMDTVHALVDGYCEKSKLELLAHKTGKISKAVLEKGMITATVVKQYGTTDGFFDKKRIVEKDFFKRAAEEHIPGGGWGIPLMSRTAKTFAKGMLKMPQEPATAVISAVRFGNVFTGTTIRYKNQLVQQGKKRKEDISVTEKKLPTEILTKRKEFLKDVTKDAKDILPKIASQTKIPPDPAKVKALIDKFNAPNAEMTLDDYVNKTIADTKHTIENLNMQFEKYNSKDPMTLVKTSSGTTLRELETSFSEKDAELKKLELEIKTSPPNLAHLQAEKNKLQMEVDLLKEDFKTTMDKLNTTFETVRDNVNILKLLTDTDFLNEKVSFTKELHKNLSNLQAYIRGTNDLATNTTGFIKHRLDEKLSRSSLLWHELKFPTPPASDEISLVEVDSTSTPPPDTSTSGTTLEHTPTSEAIKDLSYLDVLTFLRSPTPISKDDAKAINKWCIRQKGLPLNIEEFSKLPSQERNNTLGNALLQVTEGNLTNDNNILGSDGLKVLILIGPDMTDIHCDKLELNSQNIQQFLKHFSNVKNLNLSGSSSGEGVNLKQDLLDHLPNLETINLLNSNCLKVSEVLALPPTIQTTPHALRAFLQANPAYPPDAILDLRDPSKLPAQMFDQIDRAAGAPLDKETFEVFNLLSKQHQTEQESDKIGTWCTNLDIEEPAYNVISPAELKKEIAVSLLEKCNQDPSILPFQAHALLLKIGLDITGEIRCNTKKAKDELQAIFPFAEVNIHEVTSEHEAPPTKKPKEISDLIIKLSKPTTTPDDSDIEDINQWFLIECGIEDINLEKPPEGKSRAEYCAELLLERCAGNVKNEEVLPEKAYRVLKAVGEKVDSLSAKTLPFTNDLATEFKAIFPNVKHIILQDNKNISSDSFNALCSQLKSLKSIVDIDLKMSQDTLTVQNILNIPENTKIIPEEIALIREFFKDPNYKNFMANNQEFSLTDTIDLTPGSYLWNAITKFNAATQLDRYLETNLKAFDSECTTIGDAQRYVSQEKQTQPCVIVKDTKNPTQFTAVACRRHTNGFEMTLHKFEIKKGEGSDYTFVSIPRTEKENSITFSSVGELKRHLEGIAPSPKAISPAAVSGPVTPSGVDKLKIKPASENIKGLFKEVKSNSLKSLGGNFRNRDDFRKNSQWSKNATPPAISKSEFISTALVKHLMENKKDSAIGVKSENDDPILNAQGAAHTFVTPITKITMKGDYKYDLAQQNHDVSRFKADEGREVILSAAIHPDFEKANAPVVMPLVEITETATQGKNITNEAVPLWGKVKGDTKQLDQQKASYEKELNSHLVYHLTLDHRLPSKAEIAKIPILSVDAGTKLLEDLIKMPNDAPRDRRELLQGKFINLNGHTISLEALYQVYVEQMRNEFSVLEASLPQGYVYTIDPPSIFATQIGLQNVNILNRLQILALKQLNESSPLQHLKCIGFNNYADKGAVDLYKKVFPGPDKEVMAKADLFQGTDGKYNYDKPYALVIHNNSDGFGQNIETEGGKASMDAAIGQNSDAACHLARNHSQLTDKIV